MTPFKKKVSARGNLKSGGDAKQRAIITAA
jgi:hypothetical protein